MHWDGSYTWDGERGFRDFDEGCPWSEDAAFDPERDAPAWASLTDEQRLILRAQVERIATGEPL